jgi:hypothetical protein
MLPVMLYSADDQAKKEDVEKKAQATADALGLPVVVFSFAAMGIIRPYPIADVRPAPKKQPPP